MCFFSFYSFFLPSLFLLSLLIFLLLFHPFLLLLLPFSRSILFSWFSYLLIPLPNLAQSSTYIHTHTPLLTHTHTHATSVRVYRFNLSVQIGDKWDDNRCFSFTLEMLSEVPARCQTFFCSNFKIFFGQNLLLLWNQDSSSNRYALSNTRQKKTLG